ncbi:MAG: ABC transporter permease [Hamadaea sp.]|uniref:ABC transporter permease n=1 Tax=Hamadaea sp. NPDC050747 TaxID=3155789 RepID=UPI0018122404|nr:ABC transporter permease [Hamadaea sp.]NUR47825.1 ABC transporter permease [Hamadaea sp.]NUT05689.1 ABC transporter permease [Hamadaea sp.]
MAHPMLATLERELTLYRRLWQASVFSSFLLPLLFVLSIGVGVGSYVNANGGLGGVDYLSYIAPGVVITTAFQIGIGESTYPVLGGFKWTRSYQAMRSAPVEPWHMVGGHLLYLMFRGVIATIAFLIIVGTFGAMHSWWAPATILIAAIVTVSVAGPVTAFAASIENDNYFALLFRFGVIPATLFSGVFFPVDQLPALVRPLAYASPLWHGVVLSREATLGWPTPWPIWIHVGYLVAWTAVGVALAIWRFRKRLED